MGKLILKASEYSKVLDSFGFLKFPRLVGNPYSWNVFHQKAFMSFIRENTGKKICFTSNTAFPKLDRFLKPLSIDIDKLFIDLDSKRKIENALRDTRKLSKWLDKNEVPYLITFSGSKGFHIYMYFEPINADFNESLWLLYRAIHTYIKINAKLTTVDRKCKNPNRLCRIPFTRYVTMKQKEKKYEIGDTYCTPIPIETIRNCGVRAIKDIAREPNFWIPEKPNPKFDLLTWIAELRGKQSLKDWATEWSRKDEVDIKTGRIEYGEITKIQSDLFLEKVKNLIIRPCVWNELFTYNPCHEARRMGVTALKRAGYNHGQIDFDKIVELFDILAEKCGWLDKHFRYRRVYQIHSIFTNDYKMDKCSTIKTYRSSLTGKSLCVGKACPKFVEGL